MPATRNVIIIGSGPAGLTAALYSARANLQPLMIEGIEAGGQLMLTTEVENFPGFRKGILGPDLMAEMRAQAERFGTEIIQGNVTSVDACSTPIVVKTTEAEYLTKTLIIATGASARLLGSLEVDARQFGTLARWTPPRTVDEGIVATVAWWRSRQAS